jgi:YebC/PmpR family DNA-binding regulatory protein
MSGHSKWASIKHKKAATDAKRGAAFTKMTREIMAAVKEGGSDPESNFRLRAAMQRARGVNMPQSNVENAIKKASGETGVTYEEVTFDAYGPGGVALLIEGLTDNKNRTTAEVRSTLNKKNGSLAGAGSTAFLFTKKGLIIVEKEKISEDDLMEVALEAGAEDIQTEGDVHEVYCPPSSLEDVKNAIQAKGIELKVAETIMDPSSKVKVAGNDAKAVLALIEALEENEDVQNVWANFDISDEELEKAAG